MCRSPLPYVGIENESSDNVLADVWIGRYLNNFGNMHTVGDLKYDDETLYFAIKKNW